MLIEEKVARLLIKKKKTLALAESCTGGLLGHRLTNTPGSSQFLQFGIIAYSNQAKIKILKVPKKVIWGFGAVSAQTVKLMAQNVQKIFNADFSIAITGIAGPGGATATKPVGLVFIALNHKKGTLITKNVFKGTREQIKKQSADKALQMLYKLLA